MTFWSCDTAKFSAGMEASMCLHIVNVFQLNEFFYFFLFNWELIGYTGHTHLQFCTHVVSIGSDEAFYCPNCHQRKAR